MSYWLGGEAPPTIAHTHSIYMRPIWLKLDSFFELYTRWCTYIIYICHGQRAGRLINQCFGCDFLYDRYMFIYYFICITILLKQYLFHLRT